MDLAGIFQAGGWFMWAILVVFGLGSAIALERLVVVTLTQSKINQIWKQLTPMLKSRDLERADKLLKKSHSPLSRVLQYGLAKIRGNAKRESVESAMEEGVMEVLPDLEKRTHYLATLANISTLLGLLGTIVGLIQAFSAVANADPALKSELLSGSISTAMYTTAFGLIAAIPLILVHSFLATKTSRLVDNIEMATVKCLNLLSDD